VLVVALFVVFAFVVPLPVGAARPTAEKGITRITGFGSWYDLNPPLTDGEYVTLTVYVAPLKVTTGPDMVQAKVITTLQWRTGTTIVRSDELTGDIRNRDVGETYPLIARAPGATELRVTTTLLGWSAKSGTWTKQLDSADTGWTPVAPTAWPAQPVSRLLIDHADSDT
jgi:hypothetical protein